MTLFCLNSAKNDRTSKIQPQLSLTPAVKLADFALRLCAARLKQDNTRLLHNKHPSEANPRSLQLFFNPLNITHSHLHLQLTDLSFNIWLHHLYKATQVLMWAGHGTAWWWITFHQFYFTTYLMASIS